MNETAELPEVVIPQVVLDLVESLRVEAPAIGDNKPVDQLVAERAGTASWQKLNHLDQSLAQAPQAEFKLRHFFTPVPDNPKLYLCTRGIFMPAGTFLTSRIHLYEHPFVISMGMVSTWDDEHGWRTLVAPHTDVTKPGTRRFLYVHEDTVWDTFHVTAETEPDKVIQKVTFDHLKLGHLTEIPADRRATS
jgi:hypothetical protein